MQAYMGMRLGPCTDNRDVRVSGVQHKGVRLYNNYYWVGVAKVSVERGFLVL